MKVSDYTIDSLGEAIAGDCDGHPVDGGVRPHVHP